MKTKDQIIAEIESEPLEIHGLAYSIQRRQLDDLLPDELEYGNPVEFAREYLAASRRAVLHSLQRLDAPAEIIEKVFS